MADDIARRKLNFTVGEEDVEEKMSRGNRVGETEQGKMNRGK